MKKKIANLSQDYEYIKQLNSKLEEQILVSENKFKELFNENESLRRELNSIPNNSKLELHLSNHHSGDLHKECNSLSQLNNHTPEKQKSGHLQVEFPEQAKLNMHVTKSENSNNIGKHNFIFTPIIYSL